MKLSRRRFLALGGGGLCAPFLLPRRSSAAALEVIEMRGTSRGERIWFAPNGLAVSSGTVLRFVNRDPVNSHTTTAYHPDVYGRELRIPKRAKPWDSDFLLPGEHFDLVLNEPGVYDYYCIPHEMVGMVGRVVVGRPGDPGWEGPAEASEDVAREVLMAFPPVEKILAAGRIDEGNAR